ncbi:hypothetical protein GCM10009119_03850 [Algoriphagus jejuensis]|uniref:Uncharacterized protein n=1 Tax=Algoriphagus jejuensis TaxID=419934 RepID=A0ABN1MWI4_9BACT
MSKRDPIFTPELIKVLKIFLFSSLAIVFVLSFFNSYRANNSGKERTFHVADSNQLYFQNIRAIHYNRELRRDAGMVLYRHRNRLQSDSLPSLDLVILLSSVKDEAYIYFELKNADWPIQIRTDSLGVKKVFEFGNGNNQDHFDLFQKLIPAIEANAQFELVSGERTTRLWSREKEFASIKTTAEDYLSLLAYTN